MKFEITYQDGYKKTVEAESAARAHRDHKHMRTAEVGEYTPIKSVKTMEAGT